MAGKKLKYAVEWLLILTCIVILWGMLSIPILLYAFDTTSYTPSMVDVNSSNCGLSEIYSEGLCLESFSKILSSSGCQGPILVAQSNEYALTDVIYQLTHFNPSLECSQNALPFLCLYLTRLCGGDGELVQPTASQCEDIQYRTCAREWKLISAAGFPSPDCDDFPDNQNISCAATALTCQNNFYFDEDKGCVPSCQSWSELGEVTTTVLRVTVLLFVSIGIVLSIAVILVSVLKHKVMFHFPTIFLVFSTIDILFMQFITLIGYSNTSLFCSSPTLLDNSSTLFCILSGMVFNYCYIQQSLWWVFHLSVIFWGVWFPFHYNKYKSIGRFTKVSTSFTAVGILAPLLTIITTITNTAVYIRDLPNVTITSKGFGYNTFTNLPIFCGAGYSSFYTYILPLTLALAVGGSLIILIIFRFLKKKSAGASDLKLLLVLGYYFLLTIPSLAEFTMVVRVSYPLYKSVYAYFNCERNGITFGKSCPRDFERYNISYSTGVLLIILSLYPLYVLLFAVNVKKIWDICKKKIRTQSPKSISSIKETL